MAGEDRCTSAMPGSGRRCIKPLFHKGQHAAGTSVVDKWTGKMPKSAPIAGQQLSPESLRAKFADTPGQGAIDLATGEIMWED